MFQFAFFFLCNTMQPALVSAQYYDGEQQAVIFYFFFQHNDTCFSSFPSPLV